MRTLTDEQTVVLIAFIEASELMSEWPPVERSMRLDCPLFGFKPSSSDELALAANRPHPDLLEN